MGLIKQCLWMICLGVLLPVQAQALQPRSEAEAPGQVAERLETARTCRGAPYRHGGTSPKGFDRSGLVHFVFGSVGIALDHSSRAQAKEGEAIRLDQILPGDLLFFKTSGRKAISHVGIYVGDGEFIHASFWGGPKKRCVRVAELASDYFARRLVAVRRIVGPAESLNPAP